MVAMNREVVIETVHGVRTKLSADWAKRLRGRLEQESEESVPASEREPREKNQSPSS